MPDASTQHEIIHDAPDFRIRHNFGSDRSVCIITFDSLTDTPDLNRPAFAEAFLLQHGIDAIHVVNRTNIWYGYEDFEAALERVADVAKRYDRVFTYGSSMGGYAAIRWAQSVGARTAIAISPQYSVSKRLTPFEHRWRAIVGDVSRIQNEPIHGSMSVSPIVFYDPHDLDALHYELIVRNYPGAVGVAMPNAGHPAGAMLSETGMLSKTILSIVDGTFDPKDVSNALRARRRLSGQYLFTLARRVNISQPRVKQALASAAVRASRDGAYLLYAGIVAERYGDSQTCENRLEEALAVLGDHPVVLRALAAFSIRHGRAARALDYANRLCAVDPQPRYRRLQAVAYAVSGRLSEARDTMSSRRSDLVLRLSFSPALVTTLPRKLLVWWWARAYRIEAEFDLADGWRERKRMRKQLAARNGIFR
ncbi:MAG: hypothetical protein KDJ25_01735 [Rhodoblastus sp.]|nr:hypothetical protein [Rhodoblastus sp.]